MLRLMIHDNALWATNKGIVTLIVIIIMNSLACHIRHQQIFCGP
jgi:hypothetical protein